ncbi:unnamed protein product [Symbiodinium necroappetens]|uniref:Uncharacterized protein n=1 Tax=Symbiodinium necroappetens TaxID=1628268 RepID=A0A813ACR7_9DINO|nr:unnamed protein product [Symbiodinium necroappetens]
MEETAAFRSDFTALRKELADTKAIVQRQQASANEQGAWRNISWLDDLFARERQERGRAAVFSLERPKLRDEISGLKTLLRRSLDFMLTNVSAFTTGASARAEPTLGGRRSWRDGWAMSQTAPVSSGDGGTDGLGDILVEPDDINGEEQTVHPIGAAPGGVATPMAPPTRTRNPTSPKATAAGLRCLRALRRPSPADTPADFFVQLTRKAGGDLPGLAEQFWRGCRLRRLRPCPPVSSWGAASAGIPAERPEPWKMPDEAPSSAAGEFRDYGGRRGQQQQVAQVQQMAASATQPLRLYPPRGLCTGGAELETSRETEAHCHTSSAAGSDTGATDGLGVGSELPAQLSPQGQVPDEELLTDQDMEGLDDYTGFEAGTVTTSLKATLWGILLMELQLRLQKTGTDEKMLRIMENAGWAQRSPLQWCYTEWNPEQGKALPSRKDNLPHEEAKTAVARLIKSTARNDVVSIVHMLAKSFDALFYAVTKRRSTWCPALPPGSLSRQPAVGGQDVVMILQAHEDEMKSIKDLHADFRNRHGASDQHHANMQQRVDYLEKMMGDSADKHAAHVKQLEELRRSHDDMRNRHGASDQHHASVQQRVDYLEKMMGDSADKHAAHVKQLEELRRSHDDIRKKHGANDQYHASVQQRVDYLEKMLGDSADKHVAHVKQLEELRRSHDDAHGRHANVAQALKDKHASVEERLKFLEQAIGDSADRHSQELKQAKMQLEALHGKLSDEQGHREGRDKHHATLEERMRYLEQALGDSADKHSRELKAHKDGRDKQHASLEEKVKYIEKLIGDSADEHAKKLEAHKRDLEDHKRNLDDHKMQAQSQKATVERHASFEQRLDFLERALGDSAEHHTGQLRAAKAELEQKQQAHHAATGSLADRLQYLERWFGGLPGFQPPQTGTGGATLRPAWPSRSA